MRKEDMEAVGKAISVIVAKCNSRVIIEPVAGELSCSGCKWEKDDWCEECDTCTRIRTDNYERSQDE